MDVDKYVARMEWFDKAHHKSNPLLSGLLETASAVRPIETVNLVAGAGIEPASVAYETTEVPVLYPATKFVMGFRTYLSPVFMKPERGRSSTPR